MNIIYISHIPQASNMNWVSLTAKTLSLHTDVNKVIHIDVFHNEIRFKDLLLKDKFKDVLKQIYGLFFKKYINYTFFNILPFNRFKVMQKVNNNINFFLINIVLNSQHKNTILVSTSTDQSWINRIKEFIKIDLVLADCTDFWSIKNIKFMASISDVFCVNSVMMKNHISKYTKNVKLIPSGYFPMELIKKLRKRAVYKKNKSKSIILISSINWRVNFKLINAILDQLPEYKFYLVGPNVFDYFTEAGWDYKNKRVQKDWKILKKRKNFKLLSIHDQNDLQRIQIENAIGVITYDLKDRFNRFCHPIKLYQYFALGFPVVSVPVKSITNLQNDEYLHFSGSVNDFVMKIKEVENKKIKPNELNEMLRISLGQSYEAKSEKLLAIIKENL
jgi:hypothetical protein